MKEPSDWDEEYILTSLPAGEFDWFEAKGSQVVKPESKDKNRDLLSKAISAMANSGGGNLVLGIKQSGGKWVVDDGGIPDHVGRSTTREWLEDIIPNLVELPLLEFNVFAANRSINSTIAAGKDIFVIQVGDSSLAPHQASDNVYYGRVGGKSKPLGHRMILDILNRRKYPNLEMTFSYTHSEIDNPNIHKRSGPCVLLTIQIENKGPVFAQFVNCILHIPQYLVDPAAVRIFDAVHTKKRSLDYIRLVRENVIKETISHGQILSSGPGRYAPILPGRKSSFDIPLISNYEEHRFYFKENLPFLMWELYADNAPMKSGELPFSSIPFESNLFE